MAPRNDGWNGCLIAGCEGTPRLSGLCPHHDVEALAKVLEMPAYHQLSDEDMRRACAELSEGSKQG